MRLTNKLVTSGQLIRLVCLLALISQTQAMRKSKCTAERDRQVDGCAAKMGFLGDHSFKVPKNASGMDTFCTQLKENIGCIQSYSRDCLQGFTRQILTSLLKRGKQQHSLICQSDQSRRDFMNKMGCLTDDKIGKFHGCMDASIVRFEYIASQVPSENRLPSVCCSYQVFNRDVDSTLSKICKPASGARGTQQTLDFVHKIVGGTAGEFFSLICDNHRSMQECQASLKTGKVVGKLEEITAKVEQGKLKPKSKSLVPVLLEILDSSGS